jgi:hypothetical protein
VPRSFTRTDLTIGGGTVSLRVDELDWLLKGLAAQRSADATSLGEEIAMLRVAGVRIQLQPTSGERDALRSALQSGEHRSGRMPSSFARILLLVGE